VCTFVYHVTFLNCLLHLFLIEICGVFVQACYMIFCMKVSVFCFSVFLSIVTMVFYFCLLLLLLGYFFVGCYLFGLDYVDVFYVGYCVCLLS